MSRLTVTEKEHWKERIERRVSKAIESLEAKDTSLMPTIALAADRAAHDSLGTAETHGRIEAIKQQLEELKAEQERHELEMYRHALGVTACRDQSHWRLRDDFWALHRKVRSTHEERLLASSPLGQEILKLRAERDELLDTVWLATSSSQIRDLWTRVSSVLGEEATPLQQQILSSSAQASTSV